jgi:hypothetical protein
MPSNSLRLWFSVRAVALNEIEGAHRLVRGSGPGRRYATQQINQAYAVMLASQFQGFCRDLHSESADALIDAVSPPSFQAALSEEFRLHRALDRGNASPSNLGADYNRLGLNFWDRVSAHDARNSSRKVALEQLNAWRNAIVHQDFDPAKLGGPVTLQVRQVRDWRRTCDGLAMSFDAVMRTYVHEVVGRFPW